MAYRDDLEAAQERIRALEEALSDAQDEISRLRQPMVVEKPDRMTHPSIAPEVKRTRSQPIGGIYYHPPPTYFPTLRILPAIFRAALHTAPALGRFESDSVLAWSFHYCVKLPWVVVSWPGYWLSMVLLLLPTATLLCLAGAVLLLPLLLLSSLKFSPAPQQAPPPIELSEGGARMFLWLVATVFVVPMLFCGGLLRSKDADAS
jgi:hypothetical protein